MEPWRRNLYTLWAAQFIAQVGLSLVVPFMPLYIGTLGVGGLGEVERWSGVLFAAPFLAMTLAAPLWGVLGDRYGRKIMILRALGGIGVTNLLTAFVTNVWQLLGLRAAQGGVSGFVSATNALVSSSVPRDRLGAVLGVLQTSLTAGAVIGPLIGGALADLTGYRHVFVINGLMCWIAAAIVVWGVREPALAAPRAARGGVRENLALVFGSPPLRTIALLLCASQVAVLEVEPMFPLYVETLGVPPAHVATISGFLFSATGIASMIGAPLWGRWADSASQGRVVVLVLWGASVAYALQAAVHSTYTLLVFRVLLGFFVGGLLPPLYAIVARLTPPERLGGIMGITSSALMLGGLIGPLVGGVCSALFGIRPVFAMAAALLAVCALAVRGIVPPQQEPASPQHIRSLQTTETGREAP